MEETKMIISQMNVTKYVEDLQQYGITPDEQDIVHMIESIPKKIKSRMNAKQYKKVTEVQFIPRDCKDAELIRLTIDENEYGRYLKEFNDYTSIVEVLTTASMLGYYISGYTVYRGELWIDLTKDFKYDNITPDLVEFISRTVLKNYIDGIFSELKIDPKMDIDELIDKRIKNNNNDDDIDLGMP